MTINVTVEDLPDLDFVSLDMGRLNGYAGEVSIVPTATRLELKQPLRFKLKAADANSPGVELEALLMKNGSKLNLTVRPMAIPQMGPIYPFTLKSVRASHGQLKNQVATAKNTIISNEQTIPRVQNQITILANTPGGTSDERAGRK